MVSSSTAATPAAPTSSGSRWLQLVMGIVCMAMIANLQYGWTLVRRPDRCARTIIGAARRSSSPLRFSSSPKPGSCRSRRGSWTGMGPAHRRDVWRRDDRARLDDQFLRGRRCRCSISARRGRRHRAQARFTAPASVTRIKWFPDRRGLAAGATAAGFGAGAALTVVPIAKMIATSGYRDRPSSCSASDRASIVLILSPVFIARAAHAGDARHAASPLKVPQTKIDYAPQAGRCARPVFWVHLRHLRPRRGSGGLMTAAQIAPIAQRLTRSPALPVIDRSVFTDGGAHLRHFARPDFRRLRAAIFRLGVRQHRPREHDGHRLHARRR